MSEAVIPFSSSIATLQRIHEVLMSLISLAKVDLGNTDDATLQKIKIKLVKQLFINASPLIPKENFEEFSEFFLKLKPYEIDVVVQSPMGVGKKTRKKPSYSEELDIEMDKKVCELSRLLQEKKKVFMNERELGSVISEM